jgi:hypothetical protein
MAAKQLVELKDQVMELLEKVYIRPSSPPLAIFCPKEGWYSIDVHILSSSK